MNKPISMIVDETNEKIVRACNESGLPMCVLELIIKNIHNEIINLAEKGLIEDKAMYEQSLSMVKSELTPETFNVEAIKEE